MQLIGKHTNNDVTTSMSSAEFAARIDKLQYRLTTDSSYSNMLISSTDIDGTTTMAVTIPAGATLELLKSSKYTTKFSINSTKYISFDFTANTDNTDNIEPCLVLGGNIQSLK